MKKFDRLYDKAETALEKIEAEYGRLTKKQLSKLTHKEIDAGISTVYKVDIDLHKLAKAMIKENTGFAPIDETLHEVNETIKPMMNRLYKINKMLQLAIQ